jgi:hypothetical protein
MSINDPRSRPEHPRPDPNFYRNATQHPDGTWTAEPRTLDDVDFGTGPFAVKVPGVRSNIKAAIDKMAQNMLDMRVPRDRQINALITLATLTAKKDITAQEQQELNRDRTRLETVRAITAKAEGYKQAVDKLKTFDELIAYEIPWKPKDWE